MPLGDHQPVLNVFSMFLQAKDQEISLLQRQSSSQSESGKFFLFKKRASKAISDSFYQPFCLALEGLKAELAQLRQRCAELETKVKQSYLIGAISLWLSAPYRLLFNARPLWNSQGRHPLSRSKKFLMTLNKPSVLKRTSMG